LSEIENLGYAKEYAEPGYTDPERGILFANWNYFPRGVDSILEQYGFEIEWSDEWHRCDDCGKAVRHQPDSWSWQPYYQLLNECEVVCGDCLKADGYRQTDDGDWVRESKMNRYKNGYDQCAGCLVDGDVIRSDDSPQNLYCIYCTEFAIENDVELPTRGEVPDEMTVMLVEYREASHDPPCGCDYCRFDYIRR